MSKEKVCFGLVSFCVSILLLISSLVEAFDDKAHLAFSERATRVSSLDTFLKTVLGSEFPIGVDQSIEDKRVIEHIQDGAIREDWLRYWRVRHHFHNPTLSWDQAGLKPPGFSSPVGDSSIVWSQNPNQTDGGARSWHEARSFYFEALKATSQSERNRLFAETFRLLGHAIHHVQDAAAPSHTRNDNHLSMTISNRVPLLGSVLGGKSIGDVDDFHKWAETASARSLIRSLSPAPPPRSFLDNQASSDPRYPVPISRLLDVSAGDIGALALGNGDGIGLAEYSNANFFSKHTIFPEVFPYPGFANLQRTLPELDLETGKKKTYWIFKPGFGETNYRLAQGSSLRNIAATNIPTDVGLDNKVLLDYGFKLFPRAISYSAGLIDYFFRGRLELKNVQRTSATSMRINVKNASPEETGSGEVVAVAAFKSGGQDSFAASLSQGVTLTREASEVVFNFSQSPIPSDASDLSISLVYKGLLGFEEEAVVIGTCGTPVTSFITIDYPGAVRGTEIRGINDCGRIVGTAYFAVGDGSVAFIGDTTGNIQSFVYNGRLEELGSSELTEGEDINNRDQVFGWYCCGRVGDRGFRRDPDGSSFPLSYPSSTTDHIYGANDAGDVVGVYNPNPEGLTSAYVLYADGRREDLGYVTPMDINNLGQIVGYYGEDFGFFCPCHGFVQNTDGSRISFEHPGASSTIALGINDLGQIVGYSSSGGFLRNPDGSFVTIDYPGASDTYVWGINNAGEIVGQYNGGHGFVGRIPDVPQ